MIKSTVKRMAVKALAVKDAESIIRQIKDYDVVSFDVFDTLLKRDVPRPVDVFRLVEQDTGFQGFAQVRMMTEKKLRSTAGKEEVTLDEIYEAMSPAFSEAKEKELEIEARVLRRSLFMNPVYEYCRKQGKKIVLISDMYLSEDFLRAVLKRENIVYDEIFLSSAKGVQKVSGGLFRYALTTLKIRANQIIHIGDSLRGDYLGAKKAGVRSILIPKKIVRSALVSGRLSNNLQCFINNTLDTSADVYYQIGYAVLGPVLYGFTQWLSEEAKKENLKKIYFFSRDGWLMKRAWECIYGKNENVRYFYVSRRSLSVPMLWKHSAWEEIGGTMTMTRFFSVKTFLKRLGLEAEKYVPEIEQCGLTSDTIMSKAFYLKEAKLEKLYHLVEKDVIENSKKEYEALLAYLNEMDFNGKMAGVDIGWFGSMQKNLISAAKEAGIPLELEGFYFGVKKMVEGQAMRGFLYEESDRSLESTISSFQGVFESFFLAKDGSTRRYKLKYGKPVIIYEEPEYGKEDPERNAFAKVQEGAMDFLSKYKASGVASFATEKKDIWAENLCRLATYPTAKEIALFGDFRFFDTNVVYMAKPKKLTYYLGHPIQGLHDFSDSVWKQAFLLKLFKLPLPYFSMMYKVKQLLRQ